MGKIILCKGKVAEHPYYFHMGNWYIYSLEELCCYIYQNIYIISVSDFDSSMISFFRDELLLPDAAKELSEKIRSKANLKELVLYVLSIGDYYEEKDRQELFETIARMENLPPILKQKMKGDHYLKYNKFMLAQKEYENLLESKAVVGLSKQRYGDILHNLAVARTHISLGKECADLWRRAYQMNERKESLRQYLTALILSGQETFFREESEYFGISEAEMDEWKNEIYDMQERVKETEQYKLFSEAVKEKEEGQVHLYYQKTEELIEKFKQDYRREMESN